MTDFNLRSYQAQARNFVRNYDDNFRHYLMLKVVEEYTEMLEAFYPESNPDLIHLGRITGSLGKTIRDRTNRMVAPCDYKGGVLNFNKLTVLNDEMKLEMGDLLWYLAMIEDVSRKDGKEKGSITRIAEIRGVWYENFYLSQAIGHILTYAMTYTTKNPTYIPLFLHWCEVLRYVRSVSFDRTGTQIPKSLYDSIIDSVQILGTDSDISSNTTDIENEGCEKTAEIAIKAIQYLSNICANVGTTLDEIAGMNLDKLARRHMIKDES